MDLVWLKKDLRMHDHAPISSLSKSNKPCIILYLYEPDQLSEACVHGSHINFINEGLVDLDLRLQNKVKNKDITSITSNPEKVLNYEFQCITVCYTGIVFALNTIHRCIHAIDTILCHMETTHLKGYARDRAVRRWCKSNKVKIHEYNQTGVTRCLKDRDDFSKNLNAFFESAMPDVPSSEELNKIRSRLIFKNLDAMHRRCYKPIRLCDIKEMPEIHRVDRVDRQRGGETKALETLNSFLTNRGGRYSTGISSPNTSWTTGSRLSPFITWGNISLRYIISCTNKRINELQGRDKQITNGYDTTGTWIRSLSAFLSRLHWRSHFTQKLESEPEIQKNDQCVSFSHLRRQPGDFNSDYFNAWCSGRTGFPFVDACMRCLIKHGWLNFRMRAMLVSFATYNLWIDWKIIAPHLARLFLDYEPGIHYPQLQMQAGVTGINAMRVYSVTKQGKDQDPKGIFIRKYVNELKNVPLQYIHEPSKMPQHVQSQCGVRIVEKIIDCNETNTIQNKVHYYPKPVVDEVQSAKVAKDKVGSIRKLEATKQVAQQVFEKHGSRTFDSQDRDGRKPKALSNAIKRVKIDTSQPSIKSFLSQKQEETNNITTCDLSMQSYSNNCDQHIDLSCDKQKQNNTLYQSLSHKNACDDTDRNTKPTSSSLIICDVSSNIMPKKEESQSVTSNSNHFSCNQNIAQVEIIEDDFKPLREESTFSNFTSSKEKLSQHDYEVEGHANSTSFWNCQTCTFLNDKPIALVCSMCGTVRSTF